MNTVFEPSMLFIPEDMWNDEALQDAFLDHLLNNLERIRDYGITRIYWDDYCQELLWDSPQVPPWRQDKDWNNQLVPIIYRIFNQLQEPIEIENSEPCSVIPSLNLIPTKNDVFDYFLMMMQQLVIKEESVYLCLGILNNEHQSIRFHTGEGENEKAIVPILIRQASDWLNHLDITEQLWNPQISADRFRFAIELTREKHFSDAEILYDFELSRNFMRDIQNVQRGKKQILYSLTKMLTLNISEAGMDGQLQHEYIRQRKEYRFRVRPRPASTRIHYKLENDGSFVFLRYYDEGQHDIGL